MAESGGEQARRARKAVAVVVLAAALVILTCAWDWGGMCGVGGGQEAARAADWADEGQAYGQAEGQTAGSQATENRAVGSQATESQAAGSQAAEGSGSLLGAWRRAMAGKSAEEILAEEGYRAFSVEETDEVPTWSSRSFFP